MQTTDGRKIKLVSLGDMYDVTVDGEKVGVVSKRVEVYTGIRRGGRYTYWDAQAADGRRVVRRTYMHNECGGEVHLSVRSDSDPWLKPQCVGCGERFSEGVIGYRFKETVTAADGWGLTTERGRDRRLGASTRRDALAALLAAIGMALEA